MSSCSNKQRYYDDVYADGSRLSEVFACRNDNLHDVSAV